MTKIEDNLAVLLRARYPYIYIDTYEEIRVVETILRIVREYQWKDRTGTIKTLTRRVFTWSLTENWNEVSSDDSSAPPAKHSDINFRFDILETIMKVADFLLKQKSDAVFILKDFHLFLSDRRYSGVVVRKLRDLLEILRNGEYSKSVVFVSPILSIPDEMQREITVFDFPLPTEEEILSIFQVVITKNKLHPQMDECGLMEVARAALGMTALEAENAFCRAVVQRGGVDPDMIQTIFEEKKQCIRKSGILEYVDSSLTPSDVGGLDVLKAWLEKRKNSWSREAESYRIPAPKGVLITGIPGCGKSLVAKTMSAVWNLPLIQLDMGRIFSGLVGGSEENMRLAIRTAESMAPCVLWIDEIEKGLAGTDSSGDSGTSSRVLGTLLTWMQEKKSMVFLLATSNDISALKPEFLRKGRFDEIFFVDSPTMLEREEILKLHIRKHNCPAIRDIASDDEFLRSVARRTEGYVGAEIESLVLSVLFEAYAQRRAVERRDFDNAIANTVPLCRTQEEQINRIRKFAGERAICATSSAYRQDGSADAGTGRTLYI